MTCNKSFLAATPKDAYEHKGRWKAREIGKPKGKYMKRATTVVANILDNTSESITVVPTIVVEEDRPTEYTAQLQKTIQLAEQMSDEQRRQLVQHIATLSH